jgi:hypothetical protein
VSGGKVEFDRPKLDRLRAAIKAAEAAGVDTFAFDGHDYLVSYARYLVEYLESRLSE